MMNTVRARPQRECPDCGAVIAYVGGRGEPLDEDGRPHVHRLRSPIRGPVELDAERTRRTRSTVT